VNEAVIQARLEEVIAFLPDATFVIDAEGKVVLWNRAVEDMTGVKAADMLGKGNYEYAIPFYGERRPILIDLVMLPDNVVEHHYDKLLRRGKNFISVETMLPHIDRYVFGTASLIYDSNGNVVGAIESVRDITDRQRAEQAVLEYQQHLEEMVAARTAEFDLANKELADRNQQMHELNAQKSAFLSTMSHEIRTPMNAVIGMTGLLLDTSLDDDQREFVETVRTSGDALLHIINDILDFSKIEAGGLELEQQPFDLRDCVEESLELVAATSNAKGLELAGYIDAVCPSRVIGDVTRLRQVLVNLLGNAIKFTAKGDVVLSVEPDEGPLGVLRFAVTDTGIGIPPDRVASLFDSFSQVDASTTRVYGGTGLGLAISKRLVEAMGGFLGVDSIPSAGSTFHFSVRLPSAAPLTEIAGPPQATTLDGRSVLVVDDNPTNRRILRLQLESWGTSVTEADSGNAAITLVDSGAQFDAAVVDMKMPRMTGLELAVWLRSSATAHQVPILLLSSRMDRPTSQPDDLFSSVLTKPVRSARLRHSLRNALFPDEMSSAPSNLPEGSTETKRAVLRVLLAEDNAVNQRLGRLMLEKLGHHVDTVGNGREAIEAVQRVPYDVVLMDVEMPEMDGLEATRAIRRELPAHRQPQIVAMTAGALIEDRQACTEAGMDDYMAKPVRLEILGATLTRAAAARNESAMIPPGQITESDVDPNGARTIRTAAINANVIDTLVDELGDGGTTIVAELIVSYLGDCDDQLAAIHAANANHDLQIVGSVAHKMKSSTALLGADTFAGLLNDTCVSARGGGVGLDHLMTLLDEERIRVVSEMTETLHRLTPALH
jgi:signal transduction histidine kinase/DNA-binding response OmpR family regulator